MKVCFLVHIIRYVAFVNNGVELGPAPAVFSSQHVFGVSGDSLHGGARRLSETETNAMSTEDAVAWLRQIKAQIARKQTEIVDLYNLSRCVCVCARARARALCVHTSQSDLDTRSNPSERTCLPSSFSTKVEPNRTL